jgi:hypothetical protein
MPEGVLTSSEGDQKINVATTFGVLHCWVYTWPTLKGLKLMWTAAPEPSVFYSWVYTWPTLKRFETNVDSVMPPSRRVMVWIAAEKKTTHGYCTGPFGVSVF